MRGLTVFTSNRMEALAERLARSVSEPPASPMAPEIIVVQSRGMERWVGMQLARLNGICANVRFPFPNAFLEDMFFKLTPEAAGVSTFDPQVLAFRIMSLLPRHLAQPEFGSLAAYLAEDREGLKLYPLAVKLADLLDQYCVFRPDMLQRWEAGRVEPDETHRWQARLWRELCTEAGGAHRARFKEAFIGALSAGAGCLDCLPQRVSIFGISYLPPYYLDCFAALAQAIRVNFFLLNPCREYWGDIVSEREARRVEERLAAGGADAGDLHIEHGNRLLSSLGALGRAFFDLVAELGALQEDVFEEPPATNLLGRLQNDILNLRDPEREGRAGGSPAAADGSITIHSCHGPMREVEVLHDQLLAIFEEDPGLRPADIVVMTPDIDAYAPYISAVFGAAQDEATCIPFAIADRGSRGEAAAAAGFLGLLDLGGSRMGAAEVLGLLECAAIRARFEFEDGDLPVIKSWVKQSGIRWGEDENARLALNLPGYAHNSWKAGIERMLLGYAMPSRDRDLIQGVLAFDTVEGGETRTLANFLSFCDSVFALAHDLQSPRTLAGWRRRLQALLADFFAPSDEAQRETKAIQRVLEELAALQPAAGFDAPVALGVVRAFAAARFERERVGHGFLSGGVTFCAMLPMRTIPFEVVCLIGMNHDAFPRGRPPLAFDLMARHPRRGDRSRRSDDKYLFLEALLAARRRLYISFTGQSIQDNSRLPPSTTVGELIDVLAKGYLAPAGEGCDRPGLVTEHRLQAFSEAYFLEDSALFSYSPEDLTACAAGRERHQPGPFFPRPLPLAAEDVAPYREISPERLSAFLAHPAAFLVRNRIGIHLEEGPEALDDREPFALDPLARYRIGKDLLQKILAGGEPRELLDVYRAAGELPHGRAGGFLFSRMASEVARFAAAVERVLPMAGTEAFELDLPFEELHLKGRLTVPAGLGCLLLRYARLRAKDYLGLWVRHLCLGLAGSGAASRASLLIGRDAAFTFRPVAAGRRILADLLALFRRGLAAPLHFFPESSLAYFKSLQKQPADDAAALFRARQRWVQSDFSAGESEDPYYRLCFEHSDPLDADFRSLAAAVFEPLFNHCEPLAPVIDNGHRSPDTDRS